MAKSFIVAVDGMDYSGKSEIVNAIKEHITGRDVTIQKFPSEERYGKIAREYISQNKRDKFSLQRTVDCLVRDFIEAPTVSTFDEDGHRDVIIYDRWTVSTIASQGEDAYIEIKDKVDLLSEVKPELYFLLEIGYEEAVKRAGLRDKENWDANLENSFMCDAEAYEKHKERYRGAFKATSSLFTYTNHVVINAARPLEEVKKEVLDMVDCYLLATSDHYVPASSLELCDNEVDFTE